MTGELGTLVTYDWLTLTRGASNSSNSVSAGEYNFCSEECLERWLRDISA